MIRAVLLTCIAVLSLSSGPALAQNLHIHHMTLHDTDVYVHGSFGITPGWLIIDSQKVAPRIWSDSLIVTKLVGGDKGPIWVETMMDTSNPRWITSWRALIRFNLYYVKNNTLQARDSIEIISRGDVSSYLFETDLTDTVRFPGAFVQLQKLLRLEGARSGAYVGIGVPDTGVLELNESALVHGGNFEEYWRYRLQTTSADFEQRNLPPVWARQLVRSPKQRLPADRSTHPPEIPVQFVWSGVEGMDQVQLELYQDTVVVLDTMVIGTSLKYLPYLKENSTYLWRIRSLNADTATRWSPTWTFHSDKFDRRAPLIIGRSESSIYHVITIADSGRWDEGLYAVGVEVSDPLLATVVSSFDTLTRCESRFATITVEQKDTTQPLWYDVRVSDCAGNSEYYSGWFDAKEVQPDTTSGVSASPSTEAFRSFILRGKPIELQPKLNGPLACVLYDISGKVIRKSLLERTNSALLSLSSEGLRAGLYFLRVQGSNGAETIKFQIIDRGN